MILFQIKKFSFQHKVDALHLGNRSEEIMSYAARILFIESFLLLLEFKLLDLIDFVHTDNHILFISNHKRFYLDCYINIGWDNSESIERTISFFVRFVIHAFLMQAQENFQVQVLWNVQISQASR